VFEFVHFLRNDLEAKELKDNQVIGRNGAELEKMNEGGSDRIAFELQRVNPSEACPPQSGGFTHPWRVYRPASAG